MTEELSGPGWTLKAKASSEVAEQMKPLLHGPPGAPPQRLRSRGHFFLVFSDVDVPLKCVRVHTFSDSWWGFCSSSVFQDPGRRSFFTHGSQPNMKAESRGHLRKEWAINAYFQPRQRWSSMCSYVRAADRFVCWEREDGGGCYRGSQKTASLTEESGEDA